MTSSTPESRVLSGQSWDDFCDQLKRAGQQILRPEAPADELNRAEGWRYLSRLTRIALEMHVEGSDRDFPSFYQPSHETAKIGADNPDNLYLRAEINGANRYRISGNRSTVHYLSWGSQKGGYEKDGSNAQTGFIDTSTLAVDAEGCFELIASIEAPAANQPQNWLPLKAESNTIIVRQTFLDRNLERPSEMKIERIQDAGAQPQPLSAERIDQGLASAAGFVEGTARLFADWSQSYLAKPNELPMSDQALCQSVGGDPNIVYYHSYFELEQEQALHIHLPRVPECENWNLQVDNYWMESLDYRYFKIHVNKHTAHYNADGSVDILIAHREPGPLEGMSSTNWLHTSGHHKGTLCFRWIKSDEVVPPQSRVIQLTPREAIESNE